VNPKQFSKSVMTIRVGAVSFWLGAAALVAGVSCKDSGKGGGGSGGNTALASGNGGSDNQAGGDGGRSAGGSAGGDAVGAGGAVDTGGAGGTANTASGGAGSGGTGGKQTGGTGGTPTGGIPGTGGTGGTVASGDPKPTFTFFTVSQAGLLTFATDKVKGLGGDLGGLAGADKMCTELARRGSPGDTKLWKAFLSTTKGGVNEGPIHAIDRIGNGPWFDFNGRKLANNKQDLMPAAGASGGRPMGAAPQLAAMFTDENGAPVSADTNTVDNHDMLTGSDAAGKLKGTYAETCNDWTSFDDKLGKPWIGHAWPRTPSNGRNWVSDHQAGGCGKGIDTRKQASNGTPTVGAGGGYGGFYCFGEATK